MIKSLVLACFLLLGLSVYFITASSDVVRAVGGDENSLAAAAQSASEWGAVPDFALIDQNGETVRLADLRGRPFALAAIFTTCAGPCPTITNSMLGLQETLGDTDVRFVSVSVDPETDTPEVLRAYAKSYGADSERWSFLTGPEAEIFELLKGGLWLGVERASIEDAVLGMQVSHAALIVAVDAQGRKRGWYDGQDAEAVALLAERMRFLESEGK